MNLSLVVPLSGVLALALAIYLTLVVSKKSSGTSRMKEVSDAIKEGAMAYLKRQYTTLAIIIIVLFLVLYFISNYRTAVAFIVGAIFSILAGFIGMNVAVKANVRTANAARTGLIQALGVAFNGGTVMGMSVVGLGLLGVGVLYLFYGATNIYDIIGFSFGASLIALFCRVGGGIYTKAADVGADLVGKVEAGIPEDDPRNPAVIADNVGDNVGDVAGMGSDLFESYVASTIAAMLIGYIYLGIPGVLLPLFINVIGIIASILGVIFVHLRKSNDPSHTLTNGTTATIVLTAIGSFILTYLMFGFDNGLKLFFAILSGLVAGLVVGFTSDYFTNNVYRPTQRLAESAKSGTALIALAGFSSGLASTVLPIIVIGIVVVVSFLSTGNIYGMALAGVGMLAVTGMVVAADSYGPIVDNSGGIAEMSGLPESVRKITDKLDAVGNTTKAIAKGFAIGSAALTTIVLFATYAEVLKLPALDMLKPEVVAGLFIGSAVISLFIAMTISAVRKTASKMVEEIRRQFREIKGLLQGKVKPDHARCVDISTRGALKELILPGLLAILSPLIVGLVLGKGALGGLLAGSIVTGFVFALMMANAGGAWDNAKKYIEAGNFGGKGSEAHKAAVVCDTIGDPFKDTSGPSLNILIKLMATTALLSAPLILKYALLA